MPDAAVTHHPLDTATGGILLGCDYNPEQWPREVWLEDMRLMRELGVGLVAINIFGWSSINPAPGVWDFTVLDEVLELLHASGIRVNLGTGTASPPPHLAARHPDILPVADDGTRRYPGGRQAYCPSSPVFRDAALELVTRVAERYGSHPALALWHVSNELGCHNALCYCDASAEAFRTWLQARYGTIEQLNVAWGTAFWSQRYSDWSEILPPLRALSLRNPGQLLDFRRFSSDEVLGQYIAETAVLRTHSTVPVTTNFMVTAHIRTMDYWTWADRMDVIANDHYLDRRLPSPRAELSFAADLTRGLAHGGPWMLMETSTSAVNWQPINLIKGEGELVRNIASHLARGADAICFFQWRASAQGAEKYHSALLPHAGTEGEGWAQSQEIGALLRRLGGLRETRVQAQAAIVFSWESWWAGEGEGHPSEDMRYLDAVHAAHAAFQAAGVTVDVVAPGADLSQYPLVVAPMLHLVSDEDAANLASVAERGGCVLITAFSGIVDEHDRVRTGGYPGAFRDLLGIAGDTFAPLPAGTSVTLSDGSVGTVWSERVRTTDADVIATYVDGPAAGLPALTRRTVGDGAAWYLSTCLDATGYAALVARCITETGIVPVGGDADLEVVRRSGPHHSYLFAINHGSTDATVSGVGVDLVTGEHVDGRVVVPAGATRIIEEAR